MSNLMAQEKMGTKKTVFVGLTSAEVEASRREFGSNELTPPKRDPWWVLFLEKFEDPVIRILMVAAFVAIMVGFFEGEGYIYRCSKNCFFDF